MCCIRSNKQGFASPHPRCVHRVYIHIYMHTYMHTYIHAYTYMRLSKGLLLLNPAACTEYTYIQTPSVSSTSKAYYIYTYTHIYTYMNTRINTYRHRAPQAPQKHVFKLGQCSNLHTHTHTCIHTFMHIHSHMILHSCIHTHTHTYMHTYMHAYMHTYIHTSSCQKCDK
jgi:hypothetical protein